MTNIISNLLSFTETKQKLALTMRHQLVIILLCVAFALLINLASGCPYHDRIQYLKRQQNARIRELMRRDGSASHSLYNGKLDTTLRNEYIQEDRTLLRQQNEIDRLNRFLLSINSKYADRGHTHTHSTSSSDNSPQESHSHNSPSPASSGHTGSSPRSEGHSHTPSRQRDRTNHARTKPNAVHTSTDHGTSTSSASNSGRSRTPSRSGSRTATSGGHTTSLHRPPNRHYGGYNSHTGYVPGDRSTAGVTIGQAATVWKPEQYVACEGSRYHVCPLGTTCVVRFGTYRCARTVRYSCPEGFVRHNVSSTQFRCKDIDECDNVDLNTCDYVCRNTHGSFVCECNKGYEKQVDGSCSDIDECAARQHECQHECSNTLGGYDCVCPFGYRKLNSTKYCKDINECTENENQCAVGEKCLNTFGGFECNGPEECEEGYIRSNSTSDGFGPCEIEHYSSTVYKPVSISHSRFALFSKYPSNRDVAKIHFTKLPQHHYYFTVLEGRGYFRVVQAHGRNYVVIRTIRRLVGPHVYSMKILVSDINRSASAGWRRQVTKSRIDLDFTVSEFDF